MRSILHNKKDRTCFLCIILNGDYSIKRVLHEHHVLFGTAGRQLAEKYGLKVYLCPGHHENEKESVHVNAEIAKILKQAAEITFIKKYSAEMFREVFGKSYVGDIPDERLQELLEPEKESSDPAAGIQFVDYGLDEMDW